MWPSTSAGQDISKVTVSARGCCLYGVARRLDREATVSSSPRSAPQQVRPAWSRITPQALARTLEGAGR